jgi:hypothetical protein
MVLVLLRILLIRQVKEISSVLGQLLTYNFFLPNPYLYSLFCTLAGVVKNPYHAT